MRTYDEGSENRTLAIIQSPVDNMARGGRHVSDHRWLFLGILLSQSLACKMADYAELLESMSVGEENRMGQRKKFNCHRVTARLGHHTGSSDGGGLFRIALSWSIGGPVSYPIRRRLPLRKGHDLLAEDNSLASAVSGQNFQDLEISPTGLKVV
jgi:hypothetical protein